MNTFRKYINTPEGQSTVILFGSLFAVLAMKSLGWLD